jgi:LysM repeat protein
MTIAQTHAEYIASTGVLTHFDDKGRRPYQRAIDAGYSVAGNLSTGGLFTEAIFSGSGNSNQDVITAWLDNPADSPALISAEYQDVGVAVTAANGVTYFVLVAGSESSDVISIISPTLGTQFAQTGTVMPNTPFSSGEIYHIVQKDEALWSVAILYGTTIAELKSLNGLAGDEIFEGQQLLIRRASTETPTPSLVPVTATLGLSTSTATLPVTPTITQTPTPLPTPPTSMESGGMVVGGIVLVALIAAGVVSLLGKRKDKLT